MKRNLEHRAFEKQRLRLSTLRQRAKDALRDRFAGATDERGYVQWPQENLITGVKLEQVDADLRQGGGDELRTKFCSVHSSAALAVNTFAIFKERPQDLILLGRSGFSAPVFEKKLPTVGRGMANLDVWLEGSDGVIAIESRLLEYFEQKTATFSAKYNRTGLPDAESCWWQACEEATQGGRRHLDTAQLIKHYFALSRLQRLQPCGFYTLLYLFWEPQNAAEIDVCQIHRKQIETFAARVHDSAVTFKWMTYNDLWSQWAFIPGLASHAETLTTRYSISL